MQRSFAILHQNGEEKQVGQGMTTEGVQMYAEQVITKYYEVYIRHFRDVYICDSLKSEPKARQEIHNTGGICILFASAIPL